MNVMYELSESARFNGYEDLNGQFIPFETADQVFSRARALGARVLLRPGADRQPGTERYFL